MCFVFVFLWCFVCLQRNTLLLLHLRSTSLNESLQENNNNNIKNNTINPCQTVPELLQSGGVSCRRCYLSHLLTQTPRSVSPLNNKQPRAPAAERPSPRILIPASSASTASSARVASRAAQRGASARPACSSVFPPKKVRSSSSSSR